jgi:hypothetical protein
MAKRLTRKLTDVATEVEATIKREFDVSDRELDSWRNRAQNLPQSFPECTSVHIDDLWIDYEVQRDVIHKHVMRIMKKWDPRICSPVSACRVVGRDTVDTYDGQHRTLAAAILGYADIPCAVVETDDPNFPSYAFEMLNDTGVKRLGPGDLHRNALVRYRNGSREIKNVKAWNMQSQFDALGIDLEDKNTRKSDALRGSNEYFFSHFKYAQKAVDADVSGRVLHQILKAIRDNFPNNEEIDQGVFIGLYELRRLAGTAGLILPEDWMDTLLNSISKIWADSAVVHAKGRAQWAFYKGDGATWTAPTAMANFLREVHKVRGGVLDLPFHGDGSKMGIEEGVIAPGLFQ